MAPPSSPPGRTADAVARSSYTKRPPFSEAILQTGLGCCWPLKFEPLFQVQYESLCLPQGVGLHQPIAVDQGPPNAWRLTGTIAISPSSPRPVIRDAALISMLASHYCLSLRGWHVSTREKLPISY